MKKFYDELAEGVARKKINNIKDLFILRRDLCKKYKLKQMPSLIRILLNIDNRYLRKIKAKPRRVISGVAPIAIMTRPIPCPHVKKGGPCIMCPGGPGSFFGDVPQSYTGKDPATMRAIRNKFDPYLQVFNRLEHYFLMGYFPSKVELIIMGGTFPSFNKKYQEDFIKYAFKAMNDFSRLFFRENKFDFVKFKEFFLLPYDDLGDKSIAKKIQNKILRIKGKCGLEKEQKKNESSLVKCVGLTIETRSDFAKLKHGNEMLRLGATRVELGIQSVYEEVLKKIKRGHGIKENIEAMKILKDLGFKINAHYMLGLPGSDVKKDLQGLKELFLNPDYRPDMLKIYPCMVLEGTVLYDLWKKGKYREFTTKDAVKVLMEFKKFIPEYVRIMRIQRDIPTKFVAAGVDRTNLRQYLKELMHERGIKCRCIRCREVGRAEKIGKVKIKVDSYEASKGKEFFISAVDNNNVLIGFCRLRFPSQSLRKEIIKDSAIIRELHVYSPLVPVGERSEEGIQHRGYGRKLLKKAEEICRFYKKKKLLVISGVGVKAYYKKFGYKKDGPYVSKILK